MTESEHKRRRPHGGFSLMELLLVLVILGVLAALIVPKFAGRSQQARETAAKTDVSNLTGALDAFEIDNSRYPSSEEGLSALIEQPSNATGWSGPYIRGSEPTDPWGNAYVYRYPSQRNTNGFDLYSLGPDGRESEDDIGNW